MLDSTQPSSAHDFDTVNIVIIIIIIVIIIIILLIFVKFHLDILQVLLRLTLGAVDKRGHHEGAGKLFGMQTLGKITELVH